MKKIIALFAMAAAVVGVQAAEINLKVDGMVCSIGCVSKIKQSLTALEAQFHPCESQVFKPFSYRHLNT